MSWWVVSTKACQEREVRRRDAVEDVGVKSIIRRTISAGRASRGSGIVAIVIVVWESERAIDDWFVCEVMGSFGSGQ